MVGDLPYRFVVPLPVRESEVLDFSEQQWRHLDDGGMVTHDLTPAEVAQALALKRRHPAWVELRRARLGAPRVPVWRPALQAVPVVGRGAHFHGKRPGRSAFQAGGP